MLCFCAQVYNNRDFLSLTLCNKANFEFDPLQFIKYDGLGKKLNMKKMAGLFVQLSPW